MNFLKVLIGIFAAFLISLGFSTLFAVLFLTQFAAQEQQIGPILDETFSRILTEDLTLVQESLESDSEFASFFAACKDGTLSEQECTLNEENPYFKETIAEFKGTLQEQISALFSYLHPYLAKPILFVFAAVSFFLLGCILLLYSLDYNLFIFSRKLVGKLALHFLAAFLLVLFFLKLEKETIIQIVQYFVGDIPAIFSSFLAYFLLSFFSSLFQPFFLPLLILTTIFLLLWIGLWIYTWKQKKTTHQASLEALPMAPTADQK